MKTLLATLALSFAVSGAALAAPQEPINDKCPVCSKTARLIFHSNSPKGRVIFASADCKDKFDKSPTKYTVKPKG
jgi:YHS domain-containing protein